jgi:hypothetical protein
MWARLMGSEAHSRVMHTCPARISSLSPTTTSAQNRRPSLTLLPRSASFARIEGLRALGQAILFVYVLYTEIVVLRGRRDMVTAQKPRLRREPAPEPFKPPRRSNMDCVLKNTLGVALALWQVSKILMRLCQRMSTSQVSR